MSQVKRSKKSASNAVNQAGYNESVDFHEEVESSNELSNRPKKTKKKKRLKNNDEVPAVNYIDERDVENKSINNDDTIEESSNELSNPPKKTKKKKRLKNTDEVPAVDHTDEPDVENKSINNEDKNEIIIDDYNADDSIKISRRKRKVSDDEVVAKKVKKTSKSKKLKDDVDAESDNIIEFESSSKTEHKRKRKDHELLREVQVEKEDAAADTNTAVERRKKKKKDRKIDVREKRSPETEIILLSDEDVAVDTEIDRVKKKKKKKKRETDEASTATMESELEEADEVRRDENGESIDIEEHRSRKKTRRSGETNISVREFDKESRKESKANDDEASKTKAAKVRTLIIEETEDGYHTDCEITLLPEEEIIVISDDDETELSVPEKRTTEEETEAGTSRNEADNETTETATSEEKLASQEGESSSAQEPKNKNRTPKSNADENSKVEWSERDYLCEFNQIEPEIAENLLTLFKNENTIPFIARYRKGMTGGMDAEKLRSVRTSYDNIKLVKAKAASILQSIDKLGKGNPEIDSAIMNAKTMHELELIYAPLKPGTKRSYAERARELGLAQVCDKIILGQPIPDLDSLIDPEREGLRDVGEVRRGIVHILADVISKHKSTFSAIRRIKKNKPIACIITKKSQTASTEAKKQPTESLLRKFEKYFKASYSEKTIKSHNVLAINRGERLKILTVNVHFADWFQPALKRSFMSRHKVLRKISDFHWGIMEESFDDAYVRLIKPHISRQLRHQLTEKAETASIEAFAKNLKNLLLTPPLRGKTVLGIDPGFVNGCKLAVLAPRGDVLETTTIYPHISSRERGNMKRHAECLANLVKKHNCDVIALGSGTACRETEQFLNDLIKEGAFAPIDLSYTIIDEAGSSIYSCSKEAKSEFPDLDPNLISAVSIARRLQDPLGEYIKVDPKHLGVGMYQHDLPQRQVQFTLNEVISEIVSFVGVDINTASQCLLKKVAGLSEARAANIIKHRTNCGPFTNRQQLLKVCGIGPKSFEQCAGFIRILPETSLTKDGSSHVANSGLDYLDQTWIHPESYPIARKFLKACGCSLNELGTDDFIRVISSHGNDRDRKTLADEFETSETTMDIIIEGLSMKKDADIRVNEKLAPLFLKTLRRIDDLKVDTRVTGSVRNVTGFGAFVDIGIGPHGLIPYRYIEGKGLTIGQKVEVLVQHIDKARERVVLNI